jgi:hypothetical protein
MTDRITLDRLSITLRGVSRPMAEAALGGLEEALRQRLARVALASLPTSGVLAIHFAAETLPRDAAALRDAIAARVVAGLTEGCARLPEDDP